MSIQSQIDQINWYHEFDFGNGLIAKPKTADYKSHRALWSFIERELDRTDFSGKTVLDIGCWDGYWSFYAERRGAAHVLATDDRSQNWAGDTGFKLAKTLLDSNVEADTTKSIYDLGTLGRTFDVILCLGVYYHLLDPFYAFAQVRHCCHQSTIVIVEGDAVFTGTDPGVQTAAYFAADAAQAPRFVPDTETLKRMLRATYFTVEAEAAFSLQTFAAIEHQLQRNLLGTNRILLKCRPLFGMNDFHVYRPPFGLDKYDARWQRE